MNLHTTANTLNYEADTIRGYGTKTAPNIAKTSQQELVIGGVVYKLANTQEPTELPDRTLWLRGGKLYIAFGNFLHTLNVVIVKVNIAPTNEDVVGITVSHAGRSIQTSNASYNTNVLPANKAQPVLISVFGGGQSAQKTETIVYGDTLNISVFIIKTISGGIETVCDRSMLKTEGAALVTDSGNVQYHPYTKSEVINESTEAAAKAALAFTHVQMLSDLNYQDALGLANSYVASNIVANGQILGDGGIYSATENGYCTASHGVGSIFNFSRTFPVQAGRSYLITGTKVVKSGELNVSPPTLSGSNWHANIQVKISMVSRLTVYGPLEVVCIESRTIDNTRTSYMISLVVTK